MTYRAFLLAVAVLAFGCGSANDGPPPDRVLDAGLPPVADAHSTDARHADDAGHADDARVGPPPPDARGPETGTPESDPRWPSCNPAATSQDLTFVHVNDLHANYQLDATGVSPYSRIRGYYESVRAAAPYSVFTSGGDEYEKGALAEILSEGASTLAILHAMAFDVRVIGNHDYGWSENELLLMSHDDRASVLESNVTYDGSSAIGFGAEPFVELQIGCLRVGFAGLVSQPWDDQDEQVNQSFYPDLPANYDFDSQAAAIVAAHRASVDVLVFVDHIGLAYDQLLASAVHGIDVILSAHSHQLTPTPVQVGDTVIVQSGAYAEHVVRLDLRYDLGARTLAVADYSVTDVTDALPPDPATAAAIGQVLTQYAPHAGDAVASVAAAGTAESIGMVAAAAAQAKLGTDAALVDTSTVWTTWNPGTLSDQQMLDAFKVERELPGSPGFNSFYSAHVTGAGLEAIRAGLGTRFVAILPAATTASQIYSLALQKRPAFKPEAWFPGLTLTDVTFGGEAWEALDFYGRQRTASCQYLDSDAALPTCLSRPVD